MIIIHLQFYLGHIKNVPIDYQTAAYYDGENDLKLTFLKSICTQESVELSLTTCEEITKTDSQTAHASVTVSTENKFNLFVTNGKLGVAISAGWEGTWENSTTVSTSDTYTTAETYSAENSYSVEYTINTKKQEHYRYTLFGITDVYGLARTIDGKNYDIDYAFCARPESYFYALDYSVDNNFKTSSTAETKLALKDTDVENLKTLTPETTPTNESFIGSASYDSSTVDSLKNRTRYGDDDNYYGMNTSYNDSDKLDMKKFKVYFYEGYVFEFNFKLSMNILNDGVQEFYLYNYAVSGLESDAKKTRKDSAKLGLLAEKLFSISLVNCSI